MINKRQKILLDKLSRTGVLSLKEEAAAFGVSTMTIRRDIVQFEDMGLAVRSQGGAVARVSEPGQLFGGNRSTEAQKRIAAKAVELIPAACTLMLSGGTTTLEVARQLAVSGKQLAVITNSLQIAAALFQTPIQVILTGGTLRSNSLDLVGPVTEKNLDEYYIDILISGCDGAVAAEGFFTRDLNLAAMERKSVEKSRKVIIVTENSKFTHPSFVKFADPGEVAVVITDSALPAEAGEVLRKHGIEVITAGLK
ncbi:MAG: DeoR/GlpR family DNA-binding transcription regulator [Victivallales bacterium]|nr:DeoR/GlpR family DNA-binding transcription regulator [Victivallales bacterium]